jgi:hypothetical protein
MHNHLPQEHMVASLTRKAAAECYSVETLTMGLAVK